MANNEVDGPRIISTNRWRSKKDIDLGYLSLYRLKRQINEKTKVIFLADGFPKQGNTSLRTILLFVFPEMAMPEPLTHNIHIMKEAIEEKSIVLCPIRNPYETISSACNQTKRYTNKKRFSIRKTIHEYTIMMTFILKNKDSILIIKYEDVLKMCLDCENNNIENNPIIYYLQNRFDLFLDNENVTDPFIKNGSHRSIIIEERLHSFRYRRKMRKAVNLYNQAYQHSLGV